jgi:proteasome lid subunit RPN8/RPN11
MPENGISSINKGKIIIKKEAFRNMITHVLRFGSNALEKSVEVMGICLGELDENEKDIILINAIPITHGKEVSAGFTKEDYDLLTQLEKQYQKKNLNIVGWYISHPGWGLYFSDVEIKTHQFFQKESNPHGFCMVFDHTLMDNEKTFGFEIFRFDDFEKADKYHNVVFEIEEPADLDYFKWVQKFVEDFQKPEPILIKEISESKEAIPGELQEIPISEEISSGEELEDYSQFSPIISGFQKGVSKFSETVIDAFKPQFGEWINNFKEGSSKGSEYLRNSINKMKEAASQSLIKVENWFNKNMDSMLNSFKESFVNYVDQRIEAQIQLGDDLNNIKEDLLKDLDNIIDKKLNFIKNEIESVIESTTDKVKISIEMNSKIEEMIDSISEVISTIENESNNLSNKIENNIETTTNQFEKSINEKIDKMSSELQPFKEYYTEISELLEKLQKIITDFRNI